MRFDKLAYTPQQHIGLLKDRGLAFINEERAIRYLLTIGYYRLSAYFLPFQNTTDSFTEDVAFSDILDMPSL